MEAIAQGDRDNPRAVSIFGLIDYVSRRVPDISCEMTPPGPSRKACYRQVPKASMESFTASFPLLPRYAAADPGPQAPEADTTGRTPVPSGALGIAAPGQPTHFLKQLTDLRDAPRGRVLRTLPPNYAVAKVRAEGGFVLIARDGKTIGYVPEEVLTALE